MKKIVEDVTAVNPADIFNPENLRLDQSFAESVGVKKLIVTLPVKKPNPQDFVRVNPDPAFRLAVGVIELKEDREIYIVMPAVAAIVANEMFRAMLYTCINRQGVPFLWPVRLPSPDGRQSEWQRSAQEAAEVGMNGWVRVKTNMSLGAYDIFAASTVIPDPIWPELSFKEMLGIAFKDKVISTIDHPVLKRLRGE
jgi:hypothetical protein